MPKRGVYNWSKRVYMYRKPYIVTLSLPTFIFGTVIVEIVARKHVEPCVIEL